MDITILSMTPDFLKMIWTAARTCKSTQTPQQLWQEKPTHEEMLRLARNIVKSGHLSVLEHCAITFAVSGVSRALLAQYSRHRIGVSLSVQSQRAIDADDFGYVVPQTIGNNLAARMEFIEFIDTMYKQYRAFIDEWKIPKEDARFILPQATECNFVTTLNLRSLMDVYYKRVIMPGAQWEIKGMVKEMARLVTEKEPWLKEFFKEE